jgi:hypothetical protein
VSLTRLENYCVAYLATLESCDVIGAKSKNAPGPAASSSCASRPPKNPSMRDLPKPRKGIVTSVAGLPSVTLSRNHR